MKVQVNELRDTPLAWAVAKILQLKIDDTEKSVLFYEGEPFMPDVYWHQGGPIIEQEEIFLAKSILGGWTASIYTNDGGVRCTLHGGETPLIAAMRCYVASKLGDEFDVPDDLVWDELIYEKGDEE